MKKVLATILIILVSLFVFKNVILRASVEIGLRRYTGIKANIDKLEMNIGKTYVKLGGVTLYNPRGFESDVMAVIPELMIDMKVSDLFKGVTHFEKIVLNVSKVVIEKNEKGELNLTRLKGVEKKEKKKAPELKAAPGEEAKKRLRIDALVLSVGEARYIDQVNGVEKNYPINIENRVYEHLDDPFVVTQLIMFEVLTRAGLGGIGVDMDSIKSELSDMLGNTAMTEVTNRVQGFWESVKSKFGM